MSQIWVLGRSDALGVRTGIVSCLPAFLNPIGGRHKVRHRLVFRRGFNLIKIQLLSLLDQSSVSTQLRS